MVVYVGLGLLVMGGYVGDPAGRISAHLPDDNTWFEWLLAHGAYSVRHLANPLFSTRQNTPSGVNMIANTSVLGVTIPMAPVTMLVGPRWAYFVWMVGASAGTAFSAYWVLHRYVVSSRGAAFVAGALAGFAPGVIHHANGQPNFVSNFLLPLIAAQVARLAIDGRWLRDGLILGLLVTYQLFINEELLLITAVGCTMFTAVYAVIRRVEARQRALGFLRAIGIAAATAGVLCAYPIWFQFYGPRSFSGVPFFTAWGEDPVAYLTFARDTIAGSPAAELSVGRTEQNSFFGWPLTLAFLILTVLLWRRSVIARIASVTALGAALLSIGPTLRFNGHLTDIPGLLSAMPKELPVLGLLMPSRFTFVVIGAIVVILAVGWDQLSWSFGKPLIAAALLPLVPTPVPSMPDVPPPVFITSGAWHAYVKPGHTLIPVPLPSSQLGRDGLNWSASALHEFAVPEGYFLGPNVSGKGQMGPTRISTFTRLVALTVTSGKAPTLTDRDRAQIQAEVRHWRGSVLVMRAESDQDPLRALVEQVYGPARSDRDVWVWTP